ncbi:glycosyltransferase [Erythrobacter arachoides]|uniref:Glycosyltransferase n=1 Tax=Aurantiacibacter arachoides TaxID=1850444 RepID=A0A845A036_9SPHN|nr:glycosyltransferase [Aurantiacibacter arachoides]MXO92347.1 glycosyltransferase [Aurantiacibacter arachoides]
MLPTNDDFLPGRTGKIVVISDRIDWTSSSPEELVHAPSAGQGENGGPQVVGGYLERLPLALIAAGRFRHAEVWHHVIDPRAAGETKVSAWLSRRAFPIDDTSAPYASTAMAEHFRQHGPPDLLIVYGLGVVAEVIAAARGAVVVYNSIDAPALRVPEDVSALCDIILTGAEWQAEAVRARHPATPAPILPVGPEFAAPDQFRPTGEDKQYDLIYVGAAQPYKRHDILFDAVERLEGRVNALCVFGYGELAEHYRDEAQRRSLPIDFVMPPVIPFDAVNRWMSRSRIGIVAGFDDGAPAILTEYMLAGLPVLANAGLSCGLQYIVPETGEAAVPEAWPRTILAMLDRLDSYRPRETAIARWGWPVSVGKFLHHYDRVRAADAQPTPIHSSVR